jgi:hypothetical protein
MIFSNIQIDNLSFQTIFSEKLGILFNQPVMPCFDAQGWWQTFRLDIMLLNVPFLYPVSLKIG